ncbi:MAG: Na/Pi symporter [Verrucomicrobiae bacterium]|nr:Na/Pi symporter [Verrucomicrobiae bacterium]
MFELVSKILAGLGLYFVGVGGIRASLQQISGMQFREKIGQATAHPIRAALTGFLIGTVTQTSIGVAVILAGLISRGHVTVRQALPLIAWSNLGLVVLIYLSFLPVGELAMILVGVGGICVNFGLGGKYRGLAPPLYSLGLLLFGLWLLKQSLKALAIHPGFDSFMATLPASNLLAFAFGAALRVPIQSTSAVALIGIILNEAGIFSEDQALMVFYGTGLGTGLAAYYLTAHFKGEMRQVTLFEAVINGLSALFLIVMFYMEAFTGLPLLHHQLDQLSTSVEGRLAMAFLAQQLLCIVFAYVFLRQIIGWLNAWAPRTLEQDLSKPRYIHDQAVYDIETGLSLADREILGLFERLPSYLAGLRREATGTITTSVTVLHQSSLAVMGEIEVFLAALSNRRFKSHATSVNLLQVQRRMGLISSIEEALTRIMEALPKLTDDAALVRLRDNMLESLDALLLTALEAANGQAADVEVLKKLTSSPGEMAERLRQDYLQGRQSLAHADRSVILEAITQYERVMWTLNQWAGTLHPPRTGV